MPKWHKSDDVHAHYTKVPQEPGDNSVQKFKCKHCDQIMCKNVTQQRSHLLSACKKFKEAERDAWAALAKGMSSSVARKTKTMQKIMAELKVPVDGFDNDFSHDPMRGGVEEMAEGASGGIVQAVPAVWAENVGLENLRSRQQTFAKERDWNQHHTPRNLALAMVGEVGEMCEIFQWKKDADCPPGLTNWSEKQKEGLAEEMSDVLLYLVRLSDVCGIDLGAAALRKIEKNAQKYPAQHVRGSSAKYTEYANIVQQEAGAAEAESSTHSKGKK